MYFYDCCVWTLTEDVYNWCCTFIDIGAENIFHDKEMKIYLDISISATILPENSIRHFHFLCPPHITWPLANVTEVSTSSIQIFMLCVLYNNIHTVNYLKPSINFEPRFCLFVWSMLGQETVTTASAECPHHNTTHPHPHNTGIDKSCRL